MGGKDDVDPLFPTSDIEAVIEANGIASSYGGCGPIAMMGILDYFSRYMGYTSIINNPEESLDRRLLAYDVLKATKTMEISNFIPINYVESSLKENKRNSIGNVSQTIAPYSRGNKQTLTFPQDYVSAFNTLMENKYHLDKQIKAYCYNWGSTDDEEKTEYVKQSIDRGIPATIFCALGGYGDFANHYVNVYEYQEWTGIDKNGNAISNIVFKTRLNWGKKQSYDAYMDSKFLSEYFSGVIFYTLEDDNQLIRPRDFAYDFVNENEQGQYFFYEKDANIVTSDGFTFGTSRLRCGYIENEFLVLSANRNNAGLAYLEMKFNIDIKALNFDISLWSGLEGLGADDYVKLYCLNDDGDWIEQMTFDINRMSTLKEYPDNMYIEFQDTTKGIKFEVYKSSPSGGRNKGRVVIGDMNLFY